MGREERSKVLEISSTEVYLAFTGFLGHVGFDSLSITAI
jgi:hypothetical protein